MYSSLVRRHRHRSVFLHRLTVLLIYSSPTAFCVMAAVFQVHPSSLSIAAINKFRKFTAVYFSLSLASTVISTFLIVYRIITIARETDFYSQSSYRKIIEIVVESAALYSLILIIYLPLLVRGGVKDQYAQAVLTCTMVNISTGLKFQLYQQCGHQN